jgi:hypothetical protein
VRLWAAPGYFAFLRRAFLRVAFFFVAFFFVAFFFAIPLFTPLPG